MATMYYFLYDCNKKKYVDFKDLETNDLFSAFYDVLSEDEILDQNLTQDNLTALEKLTNESIRLFCGEITGYVTGTYISVKIESGYGDCSGKTCNMPNTAIVSSD